MQELLRPLELALQLGLQHPPLATRTLKALERLESQSPAALQSLAPRLVPLVEPYLAPVRDIVAAAPSRAAENRCEQRLYADKCQFKHIAVCQGASPAVLLSLAPRLVSRVKLPVAPIKTLLQRCLHLPQRLVASNLEDLSEDPLFSRSLIRVKAQFRVCVDVPRTAMYRAPNQNW